MILVTVFAFSNAQLFDEAISNSGNVQKNVGRTLFQRII